MRAVVEDTNPAIRRGFILLAIMTVAFGMAMATQQNIVTNYFEDVLKLKGPQFGYITAIREVPGFLLIFITALFYRLSIPKLTALALVLLAVGYMLFGASTTFWTVAPWVVISSMGYHTVLQTQYALGMSLTTENKSGSILGTMSAINFGGGLAAMIMVLIAFHFDILSFRPTFVIAGGLAAVASLAVFSFPNLHNGEVLERHVKREPFVVRKPYRLYYYLSLLDGARQQIFFSFGLWVLVNHYGLDVPKISGLLIAVNLIAMLSGRRIGRMIDAYGEKSILGVINVAYIVALGGYALVQNVYIAGLCYAIYSFIMPLSSVGSATYLRKVAASDDVAPSLAMGVSLQHAAAIIVPVTTGFILNFVGYQVPFLIACVFAFMAVIVTRRLNPAEQKAPERLAEDAARAAASTKSTIDKDRRASAVAGE